MKIMKKKLLALGLAGAALFVSHEAKATDLEITAKATIAQPITLTKDTANTYGTTNGDLSFGLITPGSAEGTATIFPDESGGTSWEKQFDSGILMQGNCGPAYFVIHGSPDQECSINFSNTDVTLTDVLNPAKNLSMHIVCQADRVTLDSSGDGVVTVGGDIYVPADATVGNYTGTFTVSVDYQ